MPRVKNSSSSPPAEPRLAAVPLDRLRPHPANANVMDPTLRAKLRTNLVREGTCPPVVVRPHPDKPGTFQILDGHQRVEVGRELGWEKIPCYIWPCDDATALVLLATLNRLHGEDVPALRAALLRKLEALMPLEALAALLPEDAETIRQTLRFLDLDPEALVADLTAAAARAAESGPRLWSFAVEPEDEAVIEAALAAAMAALMGTNKRGRALAGICRAWLEAAGA